MKRLILFVTLLFSVFAHAITFKEVGANTSTTWVATSSELGIWIQGAGGAGYSGCGGQGGGGGGRGALAYFRLSGVTVGTVLTLVTGAGGYAPTLSPCAAGNIGAQSYVQFPNGWTLISGGGQRAIGQSAGQGGNVAVTGTRPAGVTFGQMNLGSEIGQNGTGTNGGAGAGDGDSGGGGNGGDSGGVGTAGNGGYIHIEAY